MSNLEIWLLVGGVLSLLGLGIVSWFLVYNMKQQKHATLDKVENREHRFIYIFFKRWLVVFILFALGLCCLFCWVMFFTQI